MMRAGDTIRIRTPEGERVRGLVTDIVTLVEPVGVPGAMFPGPVTVTLTVQLDMVTMRPAKKPA